MKTMPHKFMNKLTLILLSGLCFSTAYGNDCTEEVRSFVKKEFFSTSYLPSNITRKTVESFKVIDIKEKNNLSDLYSVLFSVKTRVQYKLIPDIEKTVHYKSEFEVDSDCFILNYSYREI